MQIKNFFSGTFSRKSDERPTRGASLVEFAAVAALILVLLLGILDIARIVWIRASIKSALGFAVKRAESETASLADISHLHPGDQSYQDFLAARQKVIDEAVKYPLDFLAGGKSVAIREFNHFDQMADGNKEQHILQFAYLLPGQGGIVQDRNEFVSHSHICPPAATGTTTDNGAGAQDDQSLFDVSTSGAEGCLAPARRFDPGTESIRSLSRLYPFEVAAFVDVKTLFFGTVEMNISSAGYLAPGIVSDYGECTGPECPTPPGCGGHGCRTPTPTGCGGSGCQRTATPTPTPTQTECLPPTPTPPPTPTCLPPTPTPTPTTYTCPCGNRPVYNGSSWSCQCEDGLVRVSATDARCAPACPTGTHFDCARNDRGEAVGCCECVSDCIEPATQVFKASITIWDNVYDKQIVTDLKTSVITGDQPACVQDILKACRSNNITGEQVLTDDCVAFYFLGFGIRNRAGYGGANLLFDEYQYKYSVLPTIKAGFKQEKSTWDHNIYELTRYFDSNCQIIDYKGYTCGTMNVVSVLSPISLIWEKGAHIEDSIAYTKFPLDPENPDRYVTWRASAASPLLVHDPEHKGVVTSAAQLFGNFTFGRKWKNGYEALATLDQNGDRKLSGKELDALSLWFDTDQDGISQQSEIRTVSGSGVTAIYFDPDSSNPESGDVHASRGYDRIVKGGVETLPSVDWYSRSFNSKMDAFGYDATQSKNQSAKDSFGPQRGGRESGMPKLSGAWTWHIDEKEPSAAGPKAQGILTFKDAGDSVTGHSLIEIPLLDNREGARSAAKMYTVKGEKIVDKSGTMVVRFNLSDGRTFSEAKLSADGKTLTGQSYVETEGGSSKGIQQGRLRYSWTATRL